MVSRFQETLNADRSVEGVCRQLQKLCKKIDHPIVGVGMGLPGILHPDEKILYHSPHLPQWYRVDLSGVFSTIFEVPVYFDNDANMGARGELWLGHGKKWKHFVVLTLGTGIGGGIVLNGEVWHGANGFAGEVGHMVLDPNGPLCACGKQGCWEVYAASQFVRTGETPESLAALAKAGDSEALAAWEKYGIYLAIGIANLAHLLDVEATILSGGITLAKEFFLPTLTKTLAGMPHIALTERIRLHFSELNGDANLFGGAATVFKNNPKLF